MAFNTVGIIGKYGKQDIAPTLASLVQILHDLGAKVLTDNRTAKRYFDLNLVGKNTEDLAQASDLIIVIGGDGTFLNAARDMAPWSKAMLGVNLGRLGFLTDITPDDTMADCLGEIFAGEYLSEARRLLQASIIRGGKTISEDLALNDVVIHKWEAARMIEFETHVDGDFVNVQRSDGIIVATPTGSTAYALSGGGPIIEPGINAVALVPICPHTLSNRPIVISDQSKIAIALTKTSASRAQLTCDGHTTSDLCVGDTAIIQPYPNHIELIHPKEYEPFSTWRKKLHWSSTPH